MFSGFEFKPTASSKKIFRLKPPFQRVPKMLDNVTHPKHM